MDDVNFLLTIGIEPTTWNPIPRDKVVGEPNYVSNTRNKSIILIAVPLFQIISKLIL